MILQFGSFQAFLAAAGRFLAMGRLARADVSQADAARLAVALFLAVVGEPAAETNAAVALRAIELHVRDVDRHFLGQPASLRVFLAGPQVLVHPVDPFDDDLVAVGKDAQDLGDLALGRGPLVVAGDHFHLVVFSNLHDLLAR